jgi:glycosyltransferase involved in cell wall biosynthesis
VGSLRVALVHPVLTAYTGAERVLRALSDAFPDAPIYTSVHGGRSVAEFAGRDVRTSALQHSRFARRRHEYFPLLRAWHFEHLDLSGYDVVVSSCYSEAKAVRTPAAALHVCYLHTPPRYYWSHYRTYLETPGFGRLSPVVRAALAAVLPRLRAWDYAAAQRPDALVANSRAVADRAQAYYGRTAQVLPPPVDVARFAPPSGPAAARDGFVTVCRLVPYKRVDLAVRACAALDVPLTVVGRGPELGRLQRMAGPKTVFVTDADDPMVARHYASARALLFPQEEDFGLTAVEAMASGTPVIAFAAGGALDTVIPGHTGVFFREQTVDALAAAIAGFDDGAFNATALRAHAQGYRTEQFVDAISELIDKEWAAHQQGRG